MPSGTTGCRWTSHDCQPCDEKELMITSGHSRNITRRSAITKHARRVASSSQSQHANNADKRMLKERGLRHARSRLLSDPRNQRIVFLAGRRRSESLRRKRIPIHEQEGATVWVSPLANWTVYDLNTYRLMTGDVPRNPVSALLHMSGDCLCGAYAKGAAELGLIREWFPDVATEIDRLAADVRAAGHRPPFDAWGHGRGRHASSGRLCDSCDLALFDAV